MNLLRTVDTDLVGWVGNRFVPVAVVAIAALLAGAVLVQGVRASAEARQHVHEENRLRMESSLELIREYFEAVYSTMLFISLDEDVVALRPEARPYVQRLFDHSWIQHRLAELYLVEKGFSGERRPAMSFQRDAAGQALSRDHALALERDEYCVQRQQLQRFLTEPGLPALISREIPLCMPDGKGGRSRGLVYSIPLRAGQDLVGLVAGMVESKTILETLRRGHRTQIAFLVNELGQMLLPEEADPGIRTWFEGRFAAQGVAAFFGQPAGACSFGHWEAIWSPARIISADQWWLVFLHDENEHLVRNPVVGTLGYTALAATLLLAGLALGLLARITTQRVEEQSRHLRERRQLERQIQEVSEREQLRIGENLHEDLCQRLVGIEAYMKALQEQLTRQGRPESALATEIAAEIHQSFDCAQQLADELQPVSLRDDGFLAALEGLVTHIQHRSGVECALESDPFLHILDARVADHLYRIAQEALHNAVRHAQPKHIQVSASERDGFITLRIADDGSGLPGGRIPSGRGMGLRIMHYRCDMLGGSLSVESPPGGGTRITCRCPVPVQAAEALNPA